jgi:hypothetical protein
MATDDNTDYPYTGPISKPDLSECQSPREAMRRLRPHRKKMQDRENWLLDHVAQTTWGDRGELPEPMEDALARLQGHLWTLREIIDRLTGRTPADGALDVYPPSCRPRRELADRREGHRLHRTLASCGITEHGDFASDVLGRRVEHFRLLTSEEIGRVRSAALAKSSGREGIGRPAGEVPADPHT